MKETRESRLQNRALKVSVAVPDHIYGAISGKLFGFSDRFSLSAERGASCPSQVSSEIEQVSLV